MNQVPGGRGTSRARPISNRVFLPLHPSSNPKGIAFLIELVGNAEATAGKPRPLLCLFRLKQRGTRNRAGSASGGMN